MDRRHFISYSHRRDLATALRVYDAIQRDRPDLAPWIDKHDLPSGLQYPRFIQQAIVECTAVLFVWSRDSQKSPACQQELEIVHYYRKPMLVLKVDPDVEIMYQTAGWPHVDFTEDFDFGLVELYRQLDFLHSPAGELALLQQLLVLAERDLQNPSSARRERVEQEIKEIEQAIAELKPLVQRPRAARERAQERIERDQERERAASPTVPVQGRIRYVTPLPKLPPDHSHFQDRLVPTEELGELLGDDAVRAVVVSGEAGLGKTAMVCRLARQLDSQPEPSPVDTVIYLSTHGIGPVSSTVLLEELCRARSAGSPDDLPSRLLRRPLTVIEKLELLLPELRDIRLLLVIDGIEELFSPVTGEIRDRGLDAILTYLLSREDHSIRLVLVGHEPPRRLQERFAGHVIRDLPLDEGLPAPDARRLLERLDADGTLGLATSPALDQMCARTDGHPRALEAIYTILRHNRRASLQDLLVQTERLGHDAVVAHLITEVFNQLYRHEQRVVEALALYGRPVSAAAVDYLLQPYGAGEESERVLSRLVDLRLVRQDGPAEYSLPLPDRDLLLERIPLGTAGENPEPPRTTRMALWPRAADYFVAIRKKKEEIRHVDDLRPQLDEIDLRIAAEQVEEAFTLIDDVDNDYLHDWGWSNLVAGHREKLVGRLADPLDEILNLDGLARAEAGNDSLPDAISHFSSAVDVAEQHGRLDMTPGLHVNLGGAQRKFGQIRAAKRSYELALLGTEEYLSNLDRALALSGLAICDGEIGDFERAIEHGNRALVVSRNCARNDLQECQRLERQVLLNTGRWYGHLGDGSGALDRLQRSLARAQKAGDRALEGKCLDAIAEILIDQDQLRRAIELAQEAMAIGDEVRRPEHVAEAATTLALAHLLRGVDGLDAAQEAGKIACAHRHARGTMMALVLAEILAIRREDRLAAEIAFEDVKGDAGALLLQDDHRLEAHDILGVAHCGRAVLGEDVSGALERAVMEFNAARAMTVAPGVVSRVVRLLDELEKAAPPGLLNAPRQAAAGQTVTGQSERA